MEPATKAQVILIELKIFARILCCLIEDVADKLMVDLNEDMGGTVV